MPQAIEQLEESRPVFASLRQTQAFVVRQLAEQLELAPALADAAAGPGVPLEVASPDGGAAVALQAFSGPGLRWLSASALASPSLGFGGAITAGFAEGCSDVPHFRLDHKLLGDQVLLVLALFPRRDWFLDEFYLQLYYGSTPPGSQRSYNDVYNSALQRPGWKLYQTAALAVKPLLSSAMAFTYEPSEDNLLAARETVLEVAQLWGNLVKQQRQGGGGDSQRQADDTVRQYDARYVKAVAENPAWVALFGQEATDKLAAATHGGAAP
ncbi:expressed protein [Chlorella variabilis]|uniref:Expressed protein n=1 Tax=Chlorella variabilis TaxID=554065 RepID=E1ZI75_CHLVA|nr:expressed protein [Chlorella variabilis]EFN54590.1 expressed protein [Chlorella variabilis]|eukprot:XP_005846692.1 expressed protein [Chlorella variabilis]